MAEPTAFDMSKLFSQLVNRPVTFKLVTSPPQTKAKPLFGVYDLMPSGTAVVKTDMALIGSFGAALLGLPHQTALERVNQASLDEGLRDAMYEVLNVASTLVSVERRAVFKNMYTDPVYLSSEAQDVLRAPIHTTQFEVAVEGYSSGGFSIVS